MPLNDWKIYNLRVIVEKTKIFSKFSITKSLVERGHMLMKERERERERESRRDMRFKPVNWI